MQLHQAWEAHANDWIAWARAPGHDSYWRFHRDLFFQLVPPTGRRTVDIGCGEGRVARDLVARGHRVVAIDASPTLVSAAREADPSLDVRLANATSLPLEDASADLVIAFMSLQDVEDLDAAIREMARILEPGGCVCIAIVHPLNSAGAFEDGTAQAPFVIRGAYLEERRYDDRIERAGRAMTFCSVHRPLQAYFAALETAGLVVETLRETRTPDAAALSDAAKRWQRVPLFLHLRARKWAPVTG